jgi:hypothetical protein
LDVTIVIPLSPSFTSIIILGQMMSDGHGWVIYQDLVT